MGIVLSVLGFIGKILLWILGILCILLLLILLYPIKYQVRGEFQETAKVRGNIHWFWFLVRVHFSYEETFQWKIRLLGLDLLNLKKDSRKTEKRRSRKRQKEASRDAEESGKTVQKVVQRDAEESEKTVQGDMRRDAEKSEETVHKKIENSEKRRQEQVDEPVTGKQKKISFIKKIFSTVKKWWDKFRHLPASIKKFFSNLRYRAGYASEMISLLREDNSRDLVCIFKDNVLHLWRKLKPKVIRGHLLFGTGDPASTGEILGIFAILYAWYGDGIHITPDFDRKIWKGEIFIRGRFSVLTFVLVLARVLLSDEWGHFKKKYNGIRAKCLS